MWGAADMSNCDMLPLAVLTAFSTVFFVSNFFSFSLDCQAIKNDGAHRSNHGTSDGATLIFAMNYGGEAAAEVGAREYG